MYVQIGGQGSTSTLMILSILLHIIKYTACLQCGYQEVIDISPFVIN